MMGLSRRVFSLRGALWLAVSFAVLCMRGVQSLDKPVADEPETKETPDKNRTRILGVDLGTTYSVYSIFVNGEAHVLQGSSGRATIASYVAFKDDGTMVCGNEAKEIAPECRNVLYDSKRFIGQTYPKDDTKDQIVSSPSQAFKVVVPKGQTRAVYQLVDANNNVYKTLYPQQVSAYLLSHIKTMVKKELGYDVDNIVLTVPAYFTDRQREETKQAAAIAGFNVSRLLNEPTAAALAFGLDRRKERAKILVYDLGGGTFDVSLLDFDNGVFEVLAVSGNSHLGGVDFDDLIIQDIVTKFIEKHNIDPRTDRSAMNRLRLEAENLKIQLSLRMQMTITLDALVAGKSLEYKLMRHQFDRMCHNLIRSTIEPIDQVLTEAKVNTNDIKHLVVVGGSTRIPKVRALLEQHFNRKLTTDLNPDEAVAKGAAIQASVIDQAAETSDIVILDATPMTVGIETLGGVMTAVIPKSTTIPCEKEQIFTTAADNQTDVTIMVYQGQRPLTKDNILLGKFDIHGIPPARRGIPQIVVRFKIDVNSIMTVAAWDKNNENTKGQIVIQNDESRFSPAEVERMILDAEKNREQDNLALERIKARTDFQNRVYSVQVPLLDPTYKSRLTPSDSTAVENAINSANDWISTVGQNAEIADIAQRRSEFDQTVDSIMSKLHAAPPTAPQEEETQIDDEGL